MVYWILHCKITGEVEPVFSCTSHSEKEKYHSCPFCLSKNILFLFVSLSLPVCLSMLPLLFWCLVWCPAWGQGWVSPDCLEKLREGEPCDPSVRPNKASSDNCPPDSQCVDLFTCKSVCTAVAEGNLSRDRALQDRLKQIHCGVGDKDTPFVCCENEDIAGEVYCGGQDIRQKMEEFVGRQKDPEEEKGRERGTCGLRKVFSFNIAGGENTNPGDWPWMARLIYSQGKGPSQLCGGNSHQDR